MRSRGWISDVLACVRKLGKKEFSLRDLYAFEEELRELHPKNRQQLQVLRDQGVLRFVSKGEYEIVD